MIFFLLNHGQFTYACFIRPLFLKSCTGSSLATGFMIFKLYNMKTSWVLVLLLAIVSLLHAYKAVLVSGISGRVSPTDAVEYVWAIQGKDSLKSVPANGVFMLEAKPGLYRVIVDAKQPYKDVLLESIEVTDGKTTDLGEIKIIQ